MTVATLRAIGSLPDGGGLSPEAFAAMGLSLRELFEQHGVDERIQAIVATLWGYLGLVPRHASAFVYARIWASYHLGGCFYFQGGGQALTDALVAVIEEHRGRVVLGAPVLSIRTDAGRIVGVETKRRGAFHAPCVISTASPPCRVTCWGPWVTARRTTSLSRAWASCKLHVCFFATLCTVRLTIWSD